MSALGSVPDPALLALVATWTNDQANILLSYVWAAYDSMRANMPYVDPRDLERSITQLLEPRINDAMTGDEPFYIQHGSFEHETMASPPAQPPAYDLAFVLRADERIMWPIEAKVLETPKTVAEYERDIRQEFLTCRYGPFSGAGAMLGYLLAGTAAEALKAIEAKLGCALYMVPTFAARPHRVSNHQRTVPAGKNYPVDFHCYHLILEYTELSRSK
jgi:hypothetical protein